jgi:hypothetical protein
MTEKQRGPKKLVIDRKRWKRGDSGSALLTRSGQMCCLGFYARACGFSAKEILDVGDLESLVDFYGSAGGISKSILANENDLIRVNDSETVRGKDRERELTRLFEAYGVKLSFKG